MVSANKDYLKSFMFLVLINICKLTNMLLHAYAEQLMRALSLIIRKLMRMLSIRIKNSCVHWAYA
jgi:hypothetical protein